MRVFEGDEWKHVKDSTTGAMSRCAAQINADELRIQGRISREKWWEITNKISEPMTERYETLFAF